MMHNGTLEDQNVQFAKSLYNKLRSTKTRFEKSANFFIYANNFKTLSIINKSNIHLKLKYQTNVLYQLLKFHKKTWGNFFLLLFKLRKEVNISQIYYLMDI